MSLRKRLILSNIAMVMVPIVAFIIIEILLGAVLFGLLKMDPNGNIQTFMNIRLTSLLLILIFTNGLLTYFVYRSIIKPINELSLAAEQISEGNLDYRMEKMQNDELGKLSKTFEQMREKLKESDRLQKKYEENRKELIANISHDLKTPITSIKGYVEGIQDGVANTPEKLARYIQTIYTKALDMDYLIDELFLYSRLDLHRVPFDFEEIDIAKYLLDFVEELQFDLEQKGVIVDCDILLQGSPKVMVDREQLKRVVMNIVQNSLKHLDKEKKQIHVVLKDTKDKAIVCIQDNGCGISEDALPYIFERFYRADTARLTTNGGTGLGLAIVKRILEEHNGDIWAESIVGEGTSIFFTINKSKKR